MEIMTLLFTDLHVTKIIFTDINIHAKVFSVKVMSVIIMTDKVFIDVASAISIIRILIKFSFIVNNDKLLLDFY